MKNDNGLHLLYKNLGETPNERILRFKSENPEYESVAMTYAGRLDPMAEGLLLVVSGEEIKNKDQYQNLPKTYDIQILWGFNTDTLDVLGVIENKKIENKTIDENQVKTELKNSIGKFEQKYPAYSSKPVRGKPLFQWAREGRLGEVEVPGHTVEVFMAEFIERRKIAKEELLVNLKFKVESVRGDFRQKEIWEKWLEELSKLDSNEFIIDTLKLSVSSGFYVRQFVKDLAEKLGTVATTFHIHRAMVGEYGVADSVK